MNLDLCFTPNTKINLKCIIYLNIKTKIIKFLEENTEEFCDLGVSKLFSRQDSEITIISEKINKFDFIKIKNLLLF